MPLSYLLPFAERSSEFNWLTHGLKGQQLIMIGLRDIDSSEAKFINDYGITCFRHEEVRSQGMPALLSAALKKIDPVGQCSLHLSLDVDVLDPAEFSATGTRVPNGSSVAQVLAGIKSLQETGRLRSMDLVEFSPFGTEQDLVCARIVEKFLHTAFPN
jgi:arginase